MTGEELGGAECLQDRADPQTVLSHGGLLEVRDRESGRRGRDTGGGGEAEGGERLECARACWRWRTGACAPRGQGLHDNWPGRPAVLGSLGLEGASATKGQRKESVGSPQQVSELQQVDLGGPGGSLTD